MSELTNAELAAMETKPARDPWIKSVRASGSWLRPMRTRISIREFNFVIDQPVIKGGENDAPTPMEFLAGAVNGCITVTIEAVATELGIRLDQIETLTRSHIDVRGFTGTADVSPHFSDYSLLVQIVTPAAEPKLGELRRAVEKRCPAISLLRDADIPIDLHWQFPAVPFASTLNDRNRS
ncbi:OsmC family protein [Cryobacterium sp. PH31-O1]|uniref:OsmC family protein n=1 Tax=Cryobacterium sp. PH31-O1 TaxID=3046306 RepID=UPI0024B8EED1|nr:OsmC family protein [Cryobacterium sp. PH31-O1]MDJ0336664.1 OsmC family protein [Cryobacterium sp. PH31-O1]